jgi:phenylpyruvate tautomerase PptA (4-oxalocrotonate tautomerase family)
MIDAFIPEHALTPEAESRLLKEVTDILIRAEGYDPENEIAQSISYLFLHRPAAVFVGGVPSDSARYRFVTSAPEGQYTDAARESLVREITEAVARAEGSTFEQVARRVWIFPTEIPDGQWGAAGRINRLPDIHAKIAGEHDRKTGEARLAQRRREKAREALTALSDAVSPTAERRPAGRP